MPDLCRKCGEILKEQDWIFQLSRGVYVYGHPTPTGFGRSAILGEWHFDCFDLFPARYQELPFQCDHCREPVTNQAGIIYGVCGFRPLRPYIRPELRGDGLYFVVHERCYEEFLEAQTRHLRRAVSSGSY